LAEPEISNLPAKPRFCRKTISKRSGAGLTEKTWIFRIMTSWLLNGLWRKGGSLRWVPKTGRVNKRAPRGDREAPFRPQGPPVSGQTSTETRCNSRSRGTPDLRGPRKVRRTYSPYLGGLLLIWSFSRKS